LSGLQRLRLGVSGGKNIGSPRTFAC